MTPLIQYVSRMTITDLSVSSEEDPEELREIKLQYNPTAINRRIQANYATHAPIGFTGTIEQYVGTSNVDLSFEICYTVMSKPEYDDSRRASFFLESLMYPVANANSISSNSPPQVLVTFPNSLAMVTKVRSFEMKEEMFDGNGRVLHWTANLTFFNVARNRTTNDFIKRRGPLRDIDRVII